MNNQCVVTRSIGALYMRPRIVEFFILVEKASTSGKETSIAQRVDRGKSVFFCYFLTFNCNYPLSYYKLLNNYKNVSSIGGEI